MLPKKQAFTLIELLIVVAIIGILAAIAVPNFLNARIRAMVSRTQADLRTLVSAFEAYAIDNSIRYPPDFNCGAAPIPKESCTYNLLTTPVSYIGTIPRDVWLARDGAGTQEQRDAIGGLEYYEYWGKFTKGPGRIKKFTENGIYYIMRSVGPDMKLQMSSDTIRHIYEKSGRLSYNPSNGLRSRGDFIATNRGFE